MADSADKKRKKIQLKPPPNNAWSKSRQQAKDRKKRALENIPVLFILLDSLLPVIIEHDFDRDNLPVHDKTILNLDIFEINDMLVKTINDPVPYGETMTVDHNTTEEDVKLAIDQVVVDHGLNQSTTTDVFHPGCNLLIPDYEVVGRKIKITSVEQAIAFSFLEMDSDTDNQSAPKVYFVKRETLLRLIMDPLKRDVAFKFIAYNFKYVYGGNADHINNVPVSEYSDVSNVFTEQSQWHHLLEFCSSLSTKENINFYPPINVTQMLDDKYKQKVLLGRLTLPFYFFSIPIKSDVDESDYEESDVDNFEATSWSDLTWEQLYYKLRRKYPFSDFEATSGIVIKPRFGACGSMVIILDLKQNTVKRSTVVCRSASGKKWASPNDYYDSENQSLDVFIEPFCRDLMENEHRIFMFVPNTKKAFNMFAFTQANLDFDETEISFTDPVDTTRKDMEKMFPNLSNLLVQQLQSSKNTHMMTSGLVYRVDIFQQANLPRHDDIKARKQWRINEMELVPNAQTFITKYNEQANFLNTLGGAFKNYIIDNYDNYPV